MRQKTSLLLSNGHPDANDYPLGFLGDEVALLVKRQNAMMATLGVIVRAAGPSIMTKEGGKLFDNLIKQLSE